MIPGRWSVIVALGLLGLGVWGGILWLSLSPMADQMGIRPLVSLTNGALPRYFGTVALLLTAQLNLLIYWHRSRSRKDFLGRYRVWGWAGLFWCVLCLAQATQCHRPILDSLASYYVIQCWRGEHLFWFVPLATCLLAFYRLVGRDVNPSRASSFAWNVTFCIGLLVAGLYFGLDLLLPVAWRMPTTVALTMLWQFAMAFFCLVHARYVTHVSNEAGGKRISLRSRISRWLTARFTRFGDSILTIRFRRTFQPRKKSQTSEQVASTSRQKSKKPASRIADKTSPTDLQKKPVSFDSHPETPPAATAAQTTSETKDVSPESGKQQGAAWGARLRQRLTARWMRSSSEAEPGSKEPGTRPSVKPSVAKRVEKESKQNDKPEKQSAGKRTAPPEAHPEAASAETGSSWSQRLRTSLTSRWTRRDPPQPSATSAGPHAAVAPEKAQGETKPKAVPQPGPVAAARSSNSPPPGRPDPQSTPAPRPLPQRNRDEDDDDDDDDSDRMSRKDRKRLKKRQRQQD